MEYEGLGHYPRVWIHMSKSSLTLSRIGFGIHVHTVPAVHKALKQRRKKTKETKGERRKGIKSDGAKANGSILQKKWESWVVVREKKETNQMFVRDFYLSNSPQRYFSSIGPAHLLRQIRQVYYNTKYLQSEMSRTLKLYIRLTRQTMLRERKQEMLYQRWRDKKMFFYYYKIYYFLFLLNDNNIVSLY